MEREKWGPKEIGEFLAGLFRDAFSIERFRSYFDEDLTRNGQDVDFALAEWYALGAFTYSWSLWCVYKNNDKVQPVLDSFAPAALKLLLLNEMTKKRFLEIVRDRENEYVEAYSEVKSGTDLSKFYGRVVSHITGTFIPKMEFHLADAATCAALSHYHTGVMAANVDVIRKIEG